MFITIRMPNNKESSARPEMLLQLDRQHSPTTLKNRLGLIVSAVATVVLGQASHYVPKRPLKTCGSFT